MTQGLPGQGHSVVTVPASERTLIAVGFPALGAFVGWGVTYIAESAAEFLPGRIRGPFRFFASLDEPFATWVPVGVGVIAGLVLVIVAIRERLVVQVADDAVTLTRGDATTNRVERSQIAWVFLDGKDLVLLGRAGEELAREKSELRPPALGATFGAHSYPWRPGGDPHVEEFKLWVQDILGLPPAADALLRARATALQKHKEKDAVVLRGELLRLGVVVRDQKRRQYWRVVEE